MEFLEYYILLETSNGTYKTIPENDPYDIPISLLVLDEGTFIEEFQNNGLDNDVNIISPQPDQIIAPDDVFIALSYFRMDDINLEISQILVDGVNMTKIADMRTSNLTLVPQSLSSG